jgi:methenyltetrahydromethanopterin cyclohydrolase
MFSINESDTPYIDELLGREEELGVRSYYLENQSTVIDLGIETCGSLGAGMLATGIAAGLASSRLLLLAGVVLLGVSDIAVARERFVSPGIRHKLWGLPVYYAGMVLVALSLAIG